MQAHISARARTKSAYTFVFKIMCVDNDDVASLTLRDPAYVPCNNIFVGVVRIATIEKRERASLLFMHDSHFFARECALFYLSRGRKRERERERLRDTTRTARRSARRLLCDFFNGEVDKQGFCESRRGLVERVRDGVFLERVAGNCSRLIFR